MIRKSIKGLSSIEKLKEFQKKHNIPLEYTSSKRNMVIRGSILGLFIAFLPIPFQMLFVLLFLPLFKFNIFVAIILCWVTNPITMPFIFYIEYQIGAYLLNIEMLNVSMTLSWFNDNFDKILYPLYLGAIIVSSVTSSLSYYVITHLWKDSVKQERKNKRQKK